MCGSLRLPWHMLGLRDCKSTRFIGMLCCESGVTPFWSCKISVGWFSKAAEIIRVVRLA